MLLSKTARLLLGLEEKDAAANPERQQRRRESTVWITSLDPCAVSTMTVIEYI